MNLTAICGGERSKRPLKSRGEPLSSGRNGIMGEVRTVAVFEFAYGLGSLCAGLDRLRELDVHGLHRAEHLVALKLDFESVQVDSGCTLIGHRQFEFAKPIVDNGFGYGQCQVGAFEHVFLGIGSNAASHGGPGCRGHAGCCRGRNVAWIGSGCAEGACTQDRVVPGVYDLDGDLGNAWGLGELPLQIERAARPDILGQGEQVACR